jgi:hypothetical protein
VVGRCCEEGLINHELVVLFQHKWVVG